MFDSKHTMYPADGCIHDPPTYEEVPKASQGLSPPYGATSFPSPSTSYHSPVYAPSPLSASPYGQRLSPSPSTSNFRVSPSHSPPRSPQPSSSGSSPTKPGFMSKLTGTDPLDPPPPSFLRAPPQHLPYGPFPPCTIVGRGKNLNKGFPVLLPTSQTEPHPFTTHDVRIDDWTRFLGDVKKAERLSPMNRIVAGLAPAALGLGILPGILLAQGIEHYMKRKKRGLAAQLVDAWNNAFFHPRGMDISLVHGRIIHNGTGVVPGDLAGEGYIREQEDFDTETDDAGESAQLRKREENAAKDQPWKLVITYWHV